ncbi:MAG: hypothetical protein HHAS10_11230 [Candidatus Altimarinota bacterium]
MKKLQGAAIALTAAGALMSGSAAGSESRRVGEEVCTYSQNILSGNPSDPNGVNWHLPGFIRPIIVDCSTTVSGNTTANGKIKYTRSPSLTTPSTGTARANTVPRAQTEIEQFAAGINQPIKKGDDVKPYYAPQRKPTITITGGNVIGNASAEGVKEAGDVSLIQANPTGNTAIAQMRATDVRNQIIAALRATGATVTGDSTIKISSKIHPLTPDELGAIYAQSLQRNGNGTNRAMEEIAAYNAGSVSTAALESAIGEKRFAEATVTYTATGVNRTVDTSNWNYAYWLGILSILGLGGRGMMHKNRKKI